MTLYYKLQIIDLKIKLENAVYALIQTKIKEKLYDEDFRHEEMIMRLEQTRTDIELSPFIKPKKDKDKENDTEKINSIKPSSIIKVKPTDKEKPMVKNQMKQHGFMEK